MKKVCVITLNYNGKKDTLNLLASLVNIEKKDFQIETIVVDNGSLDDSVSAIESTYPSVTVLKNGRNLGFSGGNNIGISYALKNDASYLFLLNNDTLVKPSALRLLFQQMEQNAKVGIAAPKIYFFQPSDTIWYAGGVVDWANALCSHRGMDEKDKGLYNTIGETDFASGCAMMVKREVFDSIGMLDDDYYLYYEDADFNVRAKRAGWKILYVPEAVVWHVNASTSGGAGSPLQEYYVTRNRLLFGFRYATLRTKLALLRETLRIYFSYPTRRKAIRDFYTGRFGKGEYV